MTPAILACVLCIFDAPSNAMVASLLPQLEATIDYQSTTSTRDHVQPQWRTRRPQQRHRVDWQITLNWDLQRSYRWLNGRMR